MSYLEIGVLIGLALGHVSAFALGLWLENRKWRGIRERAGL